MKKRNLLTGIITGIMTLSIIAAPISNAPDTEGTGSSFSLVQEVSAASSFRKCYTITTSNTPVYSNSSLTSKTGSIYSTDEITVNTVTSSWTHVTYPISNGRTKSGYIRSSAILTGVNGIATKTSTGKCTTYKRPGGGSYGYICKNDQCVILGTSGNYVQIKYPVSGGYKYGFITSANAKTYLNYGGSDNGGNNNNSGSNNSSSSKIYSYSQYDSRWSSYQYGYANAARTQKATIGSGGCGVLSLTNLVANLNGKFIDPKIIADYSVRYGHRVNGVGTSYSLYKAFCSSKGAQYGIKYAGYTSSWNTLQSYLQSGNAAIVHVPGHIMTVTKYSNGKFLLVDSSPSSKRGTSSGYAWKTKAQLVSIGVSADFYIIGKR